MSRSRRFAVAVAVWVLMVLVAALTAVTGASAAAGVVLTVPGPGAIRGSYLVVLKDAGTSVAAIPQAAQALGERYGAKVGPVWQHALHGFAARMSAAQAARLAADPLVAYVQQDAVVHVTATQLNPPSWGLDRIDQRNLPLNANYTYGSTASNVRAYVIDTGIRLTHTTFGGRATWGFNAIDTTNTDCNGHGTHVAGTVGGAQYGVAKAVRLVAVKVLTCDGSGSATTVVNGVNWVTAHAVKPAVANMSLRFTSPITAVDNAVANSISSGVTYAVASGNEHVSACGQSPPRVPAALTVNASDINDNAASFSNYGTCTDLFAPGVNITSAWISSDTATTVLSGTSMATPHVTGAAAMYLSAHPTATPAQVSTALLGAATPNKIVNPGTGSPNRLLYVGVAPLNPGNQTNFRFDSVSLQLAAVGGTGTYTWSATGLPNALSMDGSTGRISGVALQVSTSMVTVTATDSANNTGATTFTWTVEPDFCHTCQALT